MYVDYMIYRKGLIIAAIFAFSWIIRHIMVAAYGTLTRTNFNNKNNKLMLLLDIGLFICVVVQLAKTRSYITQPLLYNGETVQENFFFSMMYDPYIDFHTTLASFAGICWLKFGMMFKYSHHGGPFIAILFGVMKDVMRWVFIMFVQMMFFAFIGVLLFPELPDFQSIGMALFQVMSYIAFALNYGIFDNLFLVPPMVGYVYMFFVVFIGWVIMINFLIAILCTGFANLYKTMRALYHIEVLSGMSNYGYDRTYGVLCSITAPYCALYLPFLPAYLFASRKTDCLEKLNSVLYHFVYIKIIMILLPIFMVANIIMAPFGYIASICHSICRAKRAQPKDKCFAVCRVFFWILVGPVMICIS